jgi:hypothetical protein
MAEVVHRLLESSLRDALLEDSWDTQRTNPVRRFLTSIIRDALREDSWDIRRWRQRLAVIETCQFIEAELPLINSFSNYHQLVAFAADVGRRTDGLICEFGVWRGTTINRLARYFPDRVVYGFDAFEGLPEPWRDGYPRGTFGSKQLPTVLPNVRIVPGWFHETLAPFLNKRTESAAFLHIDCDVYSSTRTVLDAFASRLTNGTVILFDEFFNYPGWKHGEHRAWSEFVTASGIEFDYLGYARASRQLAVRITRAS